VTTATAPRVAAWSDLPWQDWRLGDHVTAVGPTGAGKSHALAALASLRRYSVVVATKPADGTLEWYARNGWQRITEWPPPAGVERVLLWPPFRRPSDRARQSAVLSDALEHIFSEGVWTVVVDELHYTADTLGLADELVTYWQQGRSVSLSLVGATQRPAHVPLAAYSQARYLLLWRSTDRRDLDRLADISGDVDRRHLAQLVTRLPRFACAVVDTRDGSVTVTRAPRSLPAPTALE